MLVRTWIWIIAFTSAAWMAAPASSEAGTGMAAALSWRAPKSAAPSPLDSTLTLAEERYYDSPIEDGTTWRLESDVKRRRLYIILGGIAVTDAIGFYKLSSSWYETSQSRFHFQNAKLDWSGYRKQDKIAHAWSAYYIGNLVAQSYRWAGFSAPKSIWYGALTGYLWQLQVEVADGFFEDWGFSLIDLAANTAGAGYAVLQQFYPETLSGIRFKVSYWPSESYRKGRYPSYSDTIIDDYEGQIFWLSVNVHDLLPERARAAMPGWLKPWGLSAGHGVAGIARDVHGGDHVWYVGLDLDWSKIQVGENRLLQFVRSQLNFIHAPLPSLRFAPDGVSFGFYF